MSKHFSKSSFYETYEKEVNLCLEKTNIKYPSISPHVECAGKPIKPF